MEPHPGALRAAAAAGAEIAPDVATLFARCDPVMLMLADADAIRAVLGVGTPTLRQRVDGRTVVQMGTIGLSDSRTLADAVAEAGGTYVEAPVSGSRKQAEAGQLVAMLAGPPGQAAYVAPLLAPVCGEVIDCGAVPGGLAMKLAVNTALIAMITGLAESVHFAQHLGVPLARLAETLLAGPMANDVLRVKLPKLVASDWRTQPPYTTCTTTAGSSCGLPRPAALPRLCWQPARRSTLAPSTPDWASERGVAVRQTFEETVSSAVDERRSTGPL